MAFSYIGTGVLLRMDVDTNSPNVLGVRLVAFLLGLVLVTVLLSIPKAGLFMLFLVFLFGLGGYTLWLVGFEPALHTVPATSPPPRPTGKQ